MVTDMGDILDNHNLTTTGAAVSEGTHHAPHPAIAAAHATHWPMDTPLPFRP